MRGGYSVSPQVAVSIGYRFHAILTDQDDQNIAVIERRHRQRARVEDRIRDDRPVQVPFKDFALNEVWLQIATLAHDLIVWTPRFPAASG